MPRPSGRSRCRPATRPSGMPDRQVSPMADHHQFEAWPGCAARSSSMAGMPCTKEVPRSPCSARHRKPRYCCHTGRSSPSRAIIGGAGLLAGLGADQQLDRVAHGIDREEHDDRDRQQDEQALDQPAQNEQDHVAGFLGSRWMLHARRRAWAPLLSDRFDRSRQCELVRPAFVGQPPCGRPRSSFRSAGGCWAGRPGSCAPASCSSLSRSASFTVTSAWRSTRSSSGLP